MKQIASALVKAQREFGPALKTSTNPHFRSKYADLAACVEAVIDALNNNGIFLMQMTHETPDGAMAETVFVHESGEMLSAGKLFFPASKHDAQGYASSLSYVRRYSLMAACGIAPEDDDGNAASKPAPKPAPKVEPKVEAKPVETNAGVAEFAMNMFTEFLPEAKSEQELNAFWKENKDAVNKIKAHDESMYVELLAKFKARKDQINGN
jgi:ERF superfamily